MSVCTVCGQRNDGTGPHGCGGHATFTSGPTRPSKWCGQTQPHGPHVWGQGTMGWYTDCSGHA